MNKNIDYSKVKKIVTVGDSLHQNGEQISFDNELNRVLEKYSEEYTLIDIVTVPVSQYTRMVTQLFFGDKKKKKY